MSEPQAMSPLDAPRPPRRPSTGSRRRGLTLQDFPHLDFIDEVFLPEAQSRGVITPELDEALSQFLRELMSEASGGVAPHVEPSAGFGPAHPAALFPPPALKPAEAQAPSPTYEPPARAARRAPRPERRPSTLRLWWGRTLEAVGSDLAVHGLAYLGVLLFFVGAFGLVAFAFGDVARELRPVAEVVIAAAPFAAGALLRRRRAEFVGRALELAGGLVLPVMVVTTFNDGVDVVPDLSGASLVVALTVALALVAAAYAVWSRRVPESALRFAVAPVGWLAVAMATMGVGRAVPEGEAVANPTSWQTAALAVALVATVGWARLRPDSALALPSLTASIPGAVVVGTLAVLTWAAGAAPASAVLVAGVAVLVTVELLVPRLPEMVPGVAEPLWWLAVWSALMSGSGSNPEQTAVVSAVAALGFVVILERAGARRRRPVPALALPAFGLVLALAGTMLSPGWAAATLGAAGIWSAARRMAPFDSRHAARLLDLAAAVLPTGALLALVVASGSDSAALAAAIVLGAVAVPARRGWLDRKHGEVFWPTWWQVGSLLTTVLGVQILQGGPDVETAWVLAASFALLALGTVVGPLALVWRAPALALEASLSWLAAAAALGLSYDVRLSVLAVAGPCIVGLAHVRRVPPARVEPVSTGLTGHVLGLVAAAALIDTTWGVVLGVGMATIGWAVTGWSEAQERSTVGSALRTVHASLGWMPLALVMAGLPLTVSLVLDRSGLLPWGNEWAPAAISAVAVLLAMVPRLRPADLVPERVAVASAWGAFAVGAAAPVLGADGLPAAVTLAALALVVVMLPAGRRALPMVWVAWAVIAPAAFLAARDWWTWFALQTVDLAWVVALTAVGAALVVGAAAADLRGRPWAPRSSPVHAWALPPMAIGAADLAVGLVGGLATVQGPVAGWLCLTAAAVLMAVGLLFRAGALAAVALPLAWWAVLLLDVLTVEARPWVAVAVALALLAASQVLSMRSGQVVAAPSGPRWARWDLPVLAAAAPVAVSALALSNGSAQASLVYVAVGAECLAVAARLWRMAGAALALFVTGAGLTLVGASWEGSGWLALALLLLAIALTTVGAVMDAPLRLGFRIGGAAAAVAAWVVGVDWLGWQDQTAVDLTALVGAGIVALAAAVAFSSRVGREWALVWGGAGVVVEAMAVIASLATDATATAAAAVQPNVGPSGWAVLGLTVTATALGVAAAPTRLAWLRELGAAFLLAALLVTERLVQPESHMLVWVLCGAASAAAVALLALAGGRLALDWRRTLGALGIVLTVWAAGASLGATGPTGPTGPVLLAAPLTVAALQAAAIGVARRSIHVQLLSPAFAAAAWIVFALDALGGNPQWIAAPVGLAVLASVGLWRRDRQQHGQSVADPTIVSLEWVGVSLLVGPSIVQAVTDSLAYVAAVLALGLGVIAWGAVTKVRRRVAVGALVVLVAVLVLVAVPLVQLLPSWQGAALWALIAVVGLVAVLVAAFLERGRAAARKGLAHFTEVTQGWE